MGGVKRRPRVQPTLLENRSAAYLYDPVDVEIGNQLRRTRIFRDLSRRELGRAIGATESHVEAFESGALRIDANVVRKIGRALKVRTSFLLRRSPLDRLDAIEGTRRSERTEASPEDLAGDRVKEIFESIANPRIRDLLIDLMLVITAGETGGQRLM